MKINKVIVSCDNSHYQYYWPVVAKVCKKILKATPVLFKIDEEDSDFYFDGNGLVKKIKALPNIDTGIQSLFYRMYGTKLFPDEVCLISDIDMMLLSEEYFQGTIKDYSDDSFVVYTSDAYDIERDDSKNLFESNVYGMCYTAAKGKVFEDILNLQGSFSDFIERLKTYNIEKGLEWYGDEVYLTNRVNLFSDKYEIHRLKRGVQEGFKVVDRIEKWQFPVKFEIEQMKLDNLRDGNYDVDKLKNNYYKDCHCIRPFGWYEKEINEVANIVCSKDKIFETIENQDYSKVNDRCFIHDGDIVDIGCLNWDWSQTFIGKKRVVGVDPFENQIPHTEIFKGIIDVYDGETLMLNQGISSTSIDQTEGETVQVKTWKNFKEEYNINKISVLKLNIEGAEYSLLNTFEKEDFENIDQIAVSFHDWMVPEWKDKTDQAIQLLEKNNFTVEKINHDWGWYLATKNPNQKNKIEYLYTDINEEKVHFKYYGEKVFTDIYLKWKNLTVYYTHMELHSNHDLIYYIGAKNFFDKINEFSLEFHINNDVEIIPIELGSKNLEPTYNNELKTLPKDTSWRTYKEIFFDKVYDSNIVKVETNDVVVDIGANYGFFSVYAKNKGAKKIIAYEPSLSLQDCLKHNLNYSNIILNQIGVSGIGGTCNFDEYPISSASNRLTNDSNVGYEVQIIGINELIDSVRDNVDYLKIDCEGEEYNIFQNITSNNLKKVKKIAVEYHNKESENLILEKLLHENFVIEKNENGIIYSYNSVCFEPPKKVALISTFCDTQKKLDILEENIIKIKKLGLDVIAISPIEIPQRIVKLCDYFFYTKDNELLKWPIRMYTHWYEMRLPDGRITTLQRGLADYGWAGLHQVKKLSQIGLTFDYDMFYHLIYDIEIDDVVEQELKSNNINIIHPRRDPHHPDTLWETTLHFMVFNRELMEKVEKEITLNEYLRTNGMAEGEVLKWKNKFNIPTSNHPVKDKIFYWGDFDFFNYSPFNEFKMFISKNEPITIWLGEDPIYDTILTENLRIVFHGFENMGEIDIKINGVNYLKTPTAWEIIEFPISSQNINELVFTYNGKEINFTEKYNDIMMNQIYYNHRP